MKLNNRGIAMSSIIYSILILFLFLIIGTLSILASRKLTLDKIKNEVLEELGALEQPITQTNVASTTLIFDSFEDNTSTKELVIDFKDEYNYDIYSIDSIISNDETIDDFTLEGNVLTFTLTGVGNTSSYNTSVSYSGCPSYSAGQYCDSYTGNYDLDGNYNNVQDSETRTGYAVCNSDYDVVFGPLAGWVNNASCTKTVYNYSSYEISFKYITNPSNESDN